MVYKATQDVVRRVMPLLERLATRTIDRARLLQYLSAQAGADWGVLELVSDTPTATTDGERSRAMIFRDRGTGAEHMIHYPPVLSAELEPLVREEYKRLAVNRPLTTMAPALFAYFFGASHCAHCRWRGVDHQQIQRECHYAGQPINYEPITEPE